MNPPSPRVETHTLPRNNGLFLWAVGGVSLLLLQAIVRLGAIAYEALIGSLSPLQWSVTLGWILASAYLEGYRGFQLRFVPRVLARAHHLAGHPERVSAVLGPLYAMAFFRAKARARGAAWGVTGLVLIAIFIVRSFPQPWRGIVDVGVVIGLSWGLTCLVLGAIQRVRGGTPGGDPELPDEAASGVPVPPRVI